MAVPGTTGSHSSSSRVIQPFLAQPLDVIRPMRSSYLSNNVYVYTLFCEVFADFLIGKGPIFDHKSGVGKSLVLSTKIHDMALLFL